MDIMGAVMAEHRRAGAGASGLKAALDGLYAAFDFNERARHDPIRFPMRYKARADVEAAGFIAASLAYGRVVLFSAVLERLFALMGQSPSGFMAGFDPKKDRGLFKGIKYRFNESDDILALIYATGRLLVSFGSLERAFMEHFSPTDTDTGRALSGFVGAALAVDTSPVYGRDIKPAGFTQFFPSPAGGSACKRACLYLRWMVRDRDIDFGLWEGIPKNKLVIPLDTHIARVSRCLGLTHRKTQDWKMAAEITAALRAMDPEDPLKYDFALCHRGIEGLCRNRGCTGCALKGYAA